MTTLLRNFKLGWRKARSDHGEPQVTVAAVTDRARGTTTVRSLDIAPSDPLVAYFRSSPGVVEIDKLRLDSPALNRLRESGARLVVPLVAQGELIGLLNLGPRLSEQDYTSDDRVLLNNLATQASPAVRVAQLVREQQLEAQQRERLEQELRVARLIQQTLLPKELPTLKGWQVATYYQPARAVGGDFYDFVDLPDGRLALVIGDVTDKGVPAALVMASTRAILRAGAQRFTSPGAILEYANDLLCPDIPPNMFVTCLYAVLDPNTGRLQFANAGHDLPYRKSAAGVEELRATGMPLGLMPGMHYDEREIMLKPDDTVLFYTDGLVEAHNPQREMFGFPHLKTLLEDHPGGLATINYLLDQLAAFTGPDWEQEDDATLVVLQRASPPAPSPDVELLVGRGGEAWRVLDQFSIPSEPGNERAAMQRVVDVVQPLNLPDARLNRLKTAVAEATMNAIEHGNHNQPDLTVDIQVLTNDSDLIVQITDRGSVPVPEPIAPDLEAKLAGQQSPRGWGLFLIEKMVDEMHVSGDAHHHTLELVMHLTGGEHEHV
ncbi:MAG: SpoIIE family protein phosphatase [Chloroflexi bacterium]|nr:SpoIIE family protein phosphatase [Chloroflexota bacterium]